MGKSQFSLRWSLWLSVGLELRLTNVSLIVLHVPFPFIIPFWKKSTSFWHIDFPSHRTLTFSIYALLIQLWGHSINFSCSASFNKYQFQPVLNYSFVWNEGINLLCLVEIWWVPFAGPPVLQRLWICCVKKLQSKSILGQWCWGRSPFREWSKICSPYVFDLLLYSFHSRQSCYHTCCCLYVILASFPSSYFAIWTKIQLKAHLFPMVLTSARWGSTIDAIPVLWQVRSFSNELTKYEPWQI